MIYRANRYQNIESLRQESELPKVTTMNKHFPKLSEIYGPTDNGNSGDDWKLALFEIVVYVFLLWSLMSMIHSSPMFAS